MFSNDLWNHNFFFYLIYFIFFFVFGSRINTMIFLIPFSSCDFLFLSWEKKYSEMRPILYDFVVIPLLTVVLLFELSSTTVINYKFEQIHMNLIKFWVVIYRQLSNQLNYLPNIIFHISKTISLAWEWNVWKLV